MTGKSRRTRRKKKAASATSKANPGVKVVSLESRRKRPSAPSKKKSAASKNRRPSLAKTPQKQPTTSNRVPRQRRGNSRQARKVRRFRINIPKPILYPLRFAIVGLGIGALIGTLLAISNSRSYISVTQDVDERSETFATPAPPNPLPLKTPLVELRESATKAIAANPDLDATLLFVDLDTGEYLDVGSNRSVSAASTIKIPVLVAFLEAVDQGKARLDDLLILTEQLKGEGSGSMQYKDTGSEFSSLYVASEMSINSDNTATNMIIELLGGYQALTMKFQQWGMKQTQLTTPLPDLDGNNQTTARDLAYLMARISQGDILSPRSRDRLMRIMGDTRNNRLLPQSLGEGAAIAHKTGDIGFIIGDTGIIDMPNGKRYVASIFVERPYNDTAGKTLLHNIGRQFYLHMEKPSTTLLEPAKRTVPDEITLETALLHLQD